MFETPIWMVGNRNPSISETITSDGVAVDLSTSTVKFKARELGATALLVDQPAVIVSAPAGTVRYDWSAADIATNGILNVPRRALVWWEITTGGKTQDMMEAVIEVRAHGPEALAYVELEEFKLTSNLTGTTYADGDIRTALVAASRGIDKALGRRFYPDADVNQVRYYTIKRACTLQVDDLVTLTELAIDADGNGTFEAVWTLNTDFTLEPLNAAADGRPWEKIRRNPNTGQAPWPIPWPRSARVTGKFGWAAPPQAIKQLTTMIAARLVKRTREAPFGIVSFGLDGATVRATAYATDPDYRFLTEPYSRGHVLA